MLRLRVHQAVSALSVVAAVVGSAIIAPRVIAQIPGTVPSPTVQQPDLLPALLEEVKAIRAEVAEAVRMSARSQLLLGRVQLQQAHVSRLDQRLALATASRVEAAKAPAVTATQLQDLERRRATNPSANELQEFEAEQRRLRARLREQQSTESQWRREEAELSRTLSAEEERLRRLSSQLDALDSSLSSAPQ
jgi:hypothetical protein